LLHANEKNPAKIDSVEIDDIFGYDKLVAAEKATLQKEMNYRVGKELFRVSLARHRCSAKRNR